MLTIDQNIIVVDGRVIDLNALQVEMSFVLTVQHSRRNVRNILTGIALASDVNLVALHAKGFNKVLPEIIELIRNINFILH